MVRCESPLEKDFLYLIETSPWVLYYIEQPIKISAKIGNNIHHYTPDFFVHTQDEILLVEVKPFDRLTTPESMLQQSIGRSFCEENQITFRIVTDREIRQGWSLYNSKLLFKYSKTSTTLVEFHKVYEILEGIQYPTILELSQEMIEVGISREPLSVIYNLIFRGHILVDLSEQLTRQTPIIGWNTDC